MYAKSWIRTITLGIALFSLPGCGYRITDLARYFSGESSTVPANPTKKSETQRKLAMLETAERTKDIRSNPEYQQGRINGCMKQGQTETACRCLFQKVDQVVSHEQEMSMVRAKLEGRPPDPKIIRAYQSAGIDCHFK